MSFAHIFGNFEHDSFRGQFLIKFLLIGLGLLIFRIYHLLLDVLLVAQSDRLRCG